MKKADLLFYRSVVADKYWLPKGFQIKVTDMFHYPDRFLLWYSKDDCTTLSLSEIDIIIDCVSDVYGYDSYSSLLWQKVKDVLSKLDCRRIIQPIIISIEYEKDK